MSNVALLSIKPEFVEKILLKEKRFEYRKVIFQKPVSKIIVYCTKPVGLILAEFEVKSILADKPCSIWTQTEKYSGVRKDFFDEYYSDREIGYAIEIGKIHQYETPVNPFKILQKFTAPQSFMYLQDNHQLAESCSKAL